MTSDFRLRWSSAFADHENRFVLGLEDVATPGPVPDGPFDCVLDVPERDENFVCTGTVGALNLAPAWFERVGLRLGGWYPGQLVSAADGDFARLAGTSAMRVVALDTTHVTLDGNAPLAGARVASNRHLPDDRRVRQWLALGPGLEALDSASAGFETAPAHLARQDESDDGLFYAAPRFVHHIDSDARARIGQLYAQWIDRDANVLDLMSSWVSHYPGGNRPFGGVTGLGMNAAELAANPQLDTWVAHDLNLDPVLPFESASFGAVTCTVSFEYHRDPLRQLAEVARVLKPGGRFINTFSDRCFPTKAIALWALLHPFERLGFLAGCYHRSQCFTAIETISIHGAPRPADDDLYGQIPHADPVFAICGTRV